ncbi:MAG: ferredoxin--nitrite reductase [Pseudanabaena sp.]|jgi:ferredoxin-nitrite reductase|nr:ferredoxin--nitrite reductase [Pseudanabaena sp. M051S1SP1A06QC]MCA6590374.1 ferredoxin--nitrite reductase [Pseudanabaena sp. M109S1SP1A06QC]MCA6605616.1 ferredoxin--nitrite reductase [Pseudanabaena sp. M007S1SP1A06QC]MCA6611366.1 ferredoxin--nitrite reductase [Pseudanabaena sp. M158S2SP1A06QC]MCA6614507.1 ferredoxin--nitrite reductase [Pseudanabaena sp. M090S1SP1A06QC]MCA6622673.1 ferredoxin--nitrite reductase [Pseudanabaena sp. M165S2SP1A06QC]MCE2974944.1 ferredoxin--nitrite reductase [P
MANKIEDLKAAKDGLALKAEIDRFASIGWESINDDDLQHRLKWLGIFFRKSTPGRFMVRMRIPNGLLNSDQMRVLASVVEKCGEHGVADITTRQNIQMRGILIEDVPEMFAKFRSVGLTSVQSAIDNVRNITGSPVAGLDADELYDTRELAIQVQNLLTNNGEGNPAFTNLPRKFNIAIAGCCDNSTHAEINDLAFIPAFKETSKETFGFNVIVGGFFSAKRVEAAIPLNVWVPPEDVVALCEALLIVYRDHGLRENRAKSRLMFLIDEWGIERFRAEVEKQLGKPLATAETKDEIAWEKRDHIGVHPQKQSGLNYVGLQIPVGRMYAPDMFEFARLADVYGNGDIRLTVEQNLLITNVSDEQVPALLQEPLLQKFPVNPDNLMRGLVSCTGNQFCPVAIVETKNRSLALTRQLSDNYYLPKVVRIHWSGCPNSCAQPQVADIGFTGCKARKNGKVVDGVDIYMGGTVGKDAHLGKCVMEKVPCEDLHEVIGKLLIEHFGAVPKHQVIAEPSAKLVAVG